MSEAKAAEREEFEACGARIVRTVEMGWRVPKMPTAKFETYCGDMQTMGGQALASGFTPRPETPIERFLKERQHTLDRAKRLNRAAEILAKHPEFAELLELINFWNSST